MSNITVTSFGSLPDGRNVQLYTLTNRNGTALSVCTYGGHVQSLKKKDKQGNLVDIVLGYEDAAAYVQDTKFIGALIGRCGNRIAGGKLRIHDREYRLECNDGRNHLHGGTWTGFHKKLWQAEETAEGLKLTYTSPDGEGNYPGTLQAAVWYDLSEDDAFSIRYEAVADADTICNLTNHTYFNLNGYDSGNVLQQRIQLFADAFTESDEESLPNGNILDVAGTPMDLRTLQPIGEHIDDDYRQLQQAGGYDHNWIVRKDEAKAVVSHGMTLYPMAYAVGNLTGITLQAYTTQPGVQFYSGNHLDGKKKGKGDTVFSKRTGFCLEAQYYPNALANPNFPQPILKKGDVWKAETIYKLGTED